MAVTVGFVVVGGDGEFLVGRGELEGKAVGEGDDSGEVTGWF